MSDRRRIQRPPPTGNVGLDRWLRDVENAINAMFRGDIVIGGDFETESDVFFSDLTTINSGVTGQIYSDGTDLRISQG